MCCLCGIIDYKRSLSVKQKNRMLYVLLCACEDRGMDATGIAFNSNGQLKIFKRPLAAHKIHFNVPRNTYVVMGHTRLTTQGNEKLNYNNHPFYGYAGDSVFALAHNGVLRNDRKLRKKYHLPGTNIETDSYVIDQLIEHYGELSFASIKKTAELLKGTFTFSILDNKDNLYIVKGNNPMCIYHWADMGLYMYASTETILQKALVRLGMDMSKAESVHLENGEILRIDRNGHLTYCTFDASNLYVAPLYSWDNYAMPEWYSDCSYLDELKSVCSAFGILPDDVDHLVSIGVTPEEIEEYLYSGEL